MLGIHPFQLAPSHTWGRGSRPRDDTGGNLKGIIDRVI